MPFEATVYILKKDEIEKGQKPNTRSVKIDEKNVEFVYPAARGRYTILSMVNRGAVLADSSPKIILEKLQKAGQELVEFRTGRKPEDTVYVNPFRLDKVEPKKIWRISAPFVSVIKLYSGRQHRVFGRPEEVLKKLQAPLLRKH